MGSSPTRVVFCRRGAAIAPGAPRPPPGATASAQGPPVRGRARRERPVLGAGSGAARAPGKTPASAPALQELLLSRPSTGMVELPLVHSGFILSKKSIFAWLVSVLPKPPSAPPAAFFPQAPQAMAAGTGAKEAVT